MHPRGAEPVELGARSGSFVERELSVPLEALDCCAGVMLSVDRSGEADSVAAPEADPAAVEPAFGLVSGGGAFGEHASGVRKLPVPGCTRLGGLPESLFGVLDRL